MLKATGRRFRSCQPKSLKLIRTVWGVPLEEKASWRPWFQQLARDGFSGVECCSPGPFFPFSSDLELFRALLIENKLDLVLQIHATDYPATSASVDVHVESLRRKVGESLDLQPVLFNCHCGKDSFGTSDIVKVIEATAALERQCGVTIAHETHRQRMLCSPFTLTRLLREEPQAAKLLRLNADLSHFVIVLERLPSAATDAEFFPELLDFIAESAVYIHARVGTAQHIQVADPEDPAVAPEVEAFMDWWQHIARRMAVRGIDVRACPEFGPPPYLPLEPFTQKPLADLNQTVVKFAARLQLNLVGASPR